MQAAVPPDIGPVQTCSHEAADRSVPSPLASRAATRVAVQDDLHLDAALVRLDELVGELGARGAGHDEVGDLDARTGGGLLDQGADLPDDRDRVTADRLAEDRAGGHRRLGRVGTGACAGGGSGSGSGRDAQREGRHGHGGGRQHGQ
jgi:hypothetical protein